MSSRLQTWAEIRVVVTATFVFASGVLLASFLHGALFSPRALSTWLWFGGFVLATIMVGLLTLRATREKPETS
jgi:ABC-type multidrug transport system permease subunit